MLTLGATCGIYNLINIWIVFKRTGFKNASIVWQRMGLHMQKGGMGMAFAISATAQARNLPAVDKNRSSDTPVGAPARANTHTPLWR